MARILSYRNPTPKQLKENLFKYLWGEFSKLDKFTKRVIAITLLIVLATPFIVNQYQIFTGRAQQAPQAGTVQPSGNWSDPSTWDIGRVPKAGEAVTIKSGQTILYDIVSDEILNDINIEGTLKFSRTQNTRLKTNGHIMVHMGGNLDMGTPQDSIPKNIKAEIIFSLTQALASAFVPVDGFEPASKGLWVMDGSTWNVHGHPLVRTWSKLAQDANVGSNIVVVENDVTDWYVGGTVAVTQTSNPVSYSIDPSDGHEQRNDDPSIEHELRTIQSLEKLSDGKTQITLNQPLQFKHEGTKPFQGEVALLTRNILFTTEIVGISEATLQADIRTRKFAHTMYMANAKGNIQYAEFKYMGHYGNMGTYATHHHRMLESSRGMIVRGISGWFNGFRCTNQHVTYGVLIEDNVCYSASGSSFFVERDDLLDKGNDTVFNQDNMFIHNLAIDTQAKHFQDRLNSSGVFGEYHRIASFWPGAKSIRESYLGNVAAGGSGKGTDMSGFHFVESGDMPESMPFTFVSNEVHSNVVNGMQTWQNGASVRDMVDTKLWRNGKAGIHWGAYGNSMKYFSAQILENGIYGINILSIDPFLQDSTITGSTADNSAEDYGFFVGGYVKPQAPDPPLWIVRNTFKNLKTVGLSQVIRLPTADPCKVHDFGAWWTGTEDLREFPIVPAECSAAYMIQMNNTFENVSIPLKFGFQANPNSWWKVFDYKYPVLDVNNIDRKLSDFVVIREDQLVATNQGMLIKKLFVTDSPDSPINDGFYSPNIDGLVIPMSSLVGDISVTGLPDDRKAIRDDANFIFKIKADYPPTVSLANNVVNKVAALTATASDDKAVTKVEILADWQIIATCASSPCTANYDLSSHPRKYVYFYARAFDGTQQIKNYDQRAYSNVIELGPEIILAGQVPPNPGIVSPTPLPPTSTPIPTSTPVPTATLTPVPTRTPTPTKTPTPIPTSVPIPTATLVPTSVPTSVPAFTPTPVPTPVPCQIASASWSTTTAIQGQPVTLNVTGNSSCNGRLVAFEVREDDFILDEAVRDNPKTVAFAGNTASSTWIAEWQEDGIAGIGNPPEYFFNVSLSETPSNKVRSKDPLLEVNKTAETAKLTITSGPQALTQSDSATITWATNKESSSGIIYGISARGLRQAIGEDNTLSHLVSITGLESCAVYHYRVDSKTDTEEIPNKNFKFATSGCDASIIADVSTDSKVDPSLGGRLDLVDTQDVGISLVIPPEFNSTESDFQILKLDKQEYISKIEFPEGLTNAGGHIYRLNAFEGSQELRISQFDKPLIIKMKYSAEDIQSIKEDTLTIQKWDSAKWIELDNCEILREVKEVFCETVAFSSFILAGEQITAISIPTTAPGSYGTPSYGTPSYGTPSYGTPSSGGTTGDLNSDGKVNIFDLSILLRSWNKAGQGDLNSDGKVNIFDLSILLRGWK